jgi:hypothetical protein
MATKTPKTKVAQKPRPNSTDGSSVHTRRLEADHPGIRAKRRRDDPVEESVDQSRSIDLHTAFPPESEKAERKKPIGFTLTKQNRDALHFLSAGTRPTKSEVIRGLIPSLTMAHAAAAYSYLQGDQSGHIENAFQQAFVYVIAEQMAQDPETPIGLQLHVECRGKTGAARDNEICSLYIAFVEAKKTRHGEIGRLEWLGSQNRFSRNDYRFQQITVGDKQQWIVVFPDDTEEELANLKSRMERFLADIEGARKIRE